MDRNIQRLKCTREKLSALKSIRESQPYYGAGITFTLNIGPESDKPSTVSDVEVCDIPAIDGILDNLIAGLESSVKIQATYLRRDVKEATQLLSDIDNG